MLFNSFDFVIFYILIVGCYFLINPKYRWVLLLIGSYYFYAFSNPALVLLILASTVVDYFVGLKMGSLEKKDKKKYLYISLVVNLGLLFVFKYFNFFMDNVYFILDYFEIAYNKTDYSIILPVGISFYTFQTLSYSIDIYRGRIKPEKHFGIFALYVSFFPQLVAGPIERASRLIPQLKKKIEFDKERINSGIKLMMWGFFKKLVIAGNLAPIVNTAYNNPENFTGLQFIFIAIFFIYQIYCDFSGYSDIAIGSARVIGIDLMKNFKLPYASKSFKEFWSRWHISLSEWLRDYVSITVYRMKMKNYSVVILITFLFSGLWHGANWTFICWGLFHAIMLLIENFYGKMKKKYKFEIKIPVIIKDKMKVIIVFGLFTLSGIFFRSSTLLEAVDIFSKIIGDIPKIFNIEQLKMNLDFKFIRFKMLLIIILELIQYSNKKINIYSFISRKPRYLRWVVYYVLIFGILLLGDLNTEEFIYFQF